jgi:uncharacterized protein GlcG (DUF336 family)
MVPMKAIRILALLALVSTPVAGDELVTFKVLSPDTAMAVAQATLAACREGGFQVAVAVVDRMGVPQAMIRDRYAGPHTPDTAARKAWTAVSFREDTLALSSNTGPDSPQAGARQISQALMLGGGVPIEVAGSVVGGVGVSGAPTGADDHGCALAGIEAVQADLEF